MNEQQLTDALDRMQTDYDAKVAAEFETFQKWRRLLIEGAGFKVCQACGGDGMLIGPCRYSRKLDLMGVECCPVCKIKGFIR